VEAGKFQGYVQEFMPKAVNFGIRLLMALIVFLIGIKVIGFLRKLVCRSMERAGAETGVIQFMDSLMKVLLYFVLVMFLASGFGVDTTSVMALVGSAGLAIGLALQGSLSNFAGGVLILTLKPFRVGDYIVQSGLEGTVCEIQMFYTHLLTPDNRRVVIPNGTLANNSLTNVSAQEKRRLDVEVGISYKADLRRAKELCSELMEQDERILKEEERLVVVSELAESSVVLKLRFWVRPENYWTAMWDMNEAVKLTFDENGIEIPYPQVDVTLKQP
jgi:small conductance mechanosensitive channel